MIDHLKVCPLTICSTFEFTNTLNGFTHSALRGSRRLAVATIFTNESYFTGHSFHCVSVSTHYEQETHLGDETAKRDFFCTFCKCWLNAQQHIPIYLQPFTSYSEILGGNCNFFLPLAFNAPVGGDPLGRSSWFLVDELPDGRVYGAKISPKS